MIETIQAPKPPKGAFPPSPSERVGVRRLLKPLLGACLPVGKIWGLGCLLLFFSACSVKAPADQNAGTVIHIDSVTVYCDEAFRDLIDQEIGIYEVGQPDQHIHAIYAPEAVVLKRLEADSSCDVILGRRLKEQERSDIYHKTNLQVEEHTFATDAIAIIANRKLDKDTMPFEAVLSLLTNKSKDYDLVFEGNGSGAVTYMFAQIANTTVRPSAYAAKSIDELAEYLQKDPKGIGFIPFSRISDENDSTARSLLKKVKVLYVSKADSTGRLVSSTACQSEIADGSYPLDRPINFISHSLEEKVGVGFVNYLYKEQSGRIILKAGLVPVIMPHRVINVNTDGLK